jgi:membrane protease YdiL (CAAX protease family)
LNSEPRPAEFRAIDSFFVFLVYILGVLVLSSMALPYLARMRTPAIVVLAVSTLVLPAAVVVGARLRRRSVANLFAPGRVSPGLLYWSIAGTAGITLALLYFAEPLLDLFRRAGLDYPGEMERLSTDITSLPAGWSWLLLAGLVPVAEEAFFRGAILKGFRGSWGTAAGVLGSALLFGAFHILPIRIVVTFVLGLWFGALAVRTGGLAAPVAAHAANNALVLWLGAAGVDRVPGPAAVLGAAAAGIAAWRLFRLQGSGARRPSG